MNKCLMAILMSAALCGACECAVLRRAAISESPEKLRLVLETNVPVSYKVNKGNTFTNIMLQQTSISPSVSRSFSSLILENLNISENQGNAEIKAGYKYLTTSQISTLKDPFRLVIDFRKLSKMALPKITVPEIEKIQTRSFPDKFKIVVYLTSFVPYGISTWENGLIIELPNTNSIIKSRKMVTKDKLIPKVAVDQVGTSTIITIAQNYPSFYQIYKTENPSSLVIEFDKTSKSTIIANEISPGLKFYRFIKGSEEGPSTVNALIVDQTSLEVFPFMARSKPKDPDLIGTVGRIFTFWMPEEETRIKRETVKNMAVETGALGGVNGTFFGDLGEPLGVLVMNGELVSYSIHDRTALIIDRFNKCYIDNVALSGDVSIEGIEVQISGINTKRGLGEAMVYTPWYGNQTNEDSPGIVLSILGNEITEIVRAKGRIPKDGYALSLDPSYYETLGNEAKIGSHAVMTLRLLPLSAIADLDIKHVIGGGPRLLKSGQIYISRNSEKFKSDISKSRAARTAVGIMPDGQLAFVTVDKCKATASKGRSVGATLDELAQIMKEVGCVDAMNLDGGGSSTMVLKNEVMNSPANGAELPVSNSILIRQP